MDPADLPHTRPAALTRVAAHLQTTSSPRFIMGALLVATAGVGVLASIGMLRLGLAQMWLRYPLAAVAAYGAFLALTQTWASYVCTHPGLLMQTDQPSERRRAMRPEGKLRDHSFLDWFDVGVVDDGITAILIVAVVLIVLVLGAAIVAAPALLAEVLLDALLVSGLWRRYHAADRPSTMSGALRATWPSAAVVVVCLAVIGFALQVTTPGADSIGDVLRASR